MEKIDAFTHDQIIFLNNTTCMASSKYQLHCHNMFEVYYLIGGDVDYRIEGQEYHPKADSLLLIAPNVFHGVKINSPQPYQRFSLHFREEFLGQDSRKILTEPFLQNVIYYPHVSSFGVSHFHQSIIECLEMPEDLQFIAIRSRLIALLTQICHMHRLGGGQIASPHPQIQKILAYISDNLTEPLSLDELSHRFFVSKNHLNVLFRQATGTTVNQYIQLKRLTLAQAEIISGTSAGKASEMSGFKDYSNFYRAYKKFFRCAPTNPCPPSIHT